jgi:hypothetical protein
MAHGKAQTKKPPSQGRQVVAYAAARLPCMREDVSAEDRESKILLAAMLGGRSPGAVSGRVLQQCAPLEIRREGATMKTPEELDGLTRKEREG